MVNDLAFRRLESHAETNVVNCLRRVGIDATCITSLDNANSFVFKVELRDEAYLAKYVYRGLSKSSLSRRLSLQPKFEEELLGSVGNFSVDSSPLRSEFRALRVMRSYLGESVPRPIAYYGGVLLEEFVVSDGNALEACLSDQRDEPALTPVVALLRQIWELDANLPDSDSWEESNRSRADILATSVRKFPNVAGMVRTLSGFTGGSLSLSVLCAHLLDFRSPANDLLTQFGSHWISGDAKLEHFLYSENRTVWVDPSPFRGSAVSDLARCWSRLVLNAMVVEDWGCLEFCVSSIYAVLLNALEYKGYDLVEVSHLFGYLSVMDLINILSTYMVARSSGQFSTGFLADVVDQSPKLLWSLVSVNGLQGSLAFGDLIGVVGEWKSIFEGVRLR